MLDRLCQFSYISEKMDRPIRMTFEILKKEVQLHDSTGKQNIACYVSAPSDCIIFRFPVDLNPWPRVCSYPVVFCFSSGLPAEREPMPTAASTAAFFV
jgi:hypothetical protein